MIAAASDSTTSNPLAPCPNTPNCERRTFFFDVPPDTLLRLANAALDKLRPLSTKALPDRRIESVHKVVVYRDDLELQVEVQAPGALIHLRSASREGTWDLGVNRRRVNRFMRYLNRLVVDWRLTDSDHAR